MALDLSIVGRESAPASFSYDHRTLALYALGVGAKRDELPFLYEGARGGMKVLPSFAVVPAYAPVMELLGASGGDMAMVVHGAQTVRVLGQAPSEATLSTVAKVEAVYDLKKFAQVILSTTSLLGAAPLFATTWSIIFRNAGGFGGPRPPESEAPPLPKDREPDWVAREATSPEQALLCRLSGDPNPLHACGGEPSRLRTFAAQFRRPVWPGDTLVTRGFSLEGGKVAIDTRVAERDESVLASAWAAVGD